MNDQIAAREGRDLGATTLFGAVPADADSAVPGRASVFDVCNVGVVLRAVLLAHGALAVACAFTATGWLDWLLQSAAGASTVLPATLMWLVGACLGKHWLQAIGPASQWAVMVSLGALCSFAAWWWAARLGIVEVGGLGALGPLLAGASLGAAAYFWLLARARMQRPAADVARLA